MEKWEFGITALVEEELCMMELSKERAEQEREEEGEKGKARERERNVIKTNVRIIFLRSPRQCVFIPSHLGNHFLFSPFI